MIKHAYIGNIIFAVILAATLASCGFHLRGNIPLPENIKNMYVQAPAGTFKDQLEDILTNLGANLASSQAGADVVLNVLDANSTRTVGTLDERGKANSYNLSFYVRYDLNDPNGKLIRTAALTETRRYNFDPGFVVESESEEADLQEDMEESISLRLVRQLSALTDYAPAE